MKPVMKSQLKHNQVDKQVILINSDTDEPKAVRHQKRKGTFKVDKTMHRPLKQSRKSFGSPNGSRQDPIHIASHSDDEVKFMGSIQRSVRDRGPSPRSCLQDDQVWIQSESENGSEPQKKMHAQQMGSIAEIADCEQTLPDGLQVSRR